MTRVIRLDLTKETPSENSSLILEDAEARVSIRQSQVLNSAASAFVFRVSNRENKLSEKIYSFPHRTLKGNAIFAMGIVTGDNEKYIKKNLAPATEPILLGRDIESFQVAKPSHYIKFEPSRFQQCSKEAYFREKEKLIYRFIATRLIVAYDNSGSLTLNSANLLLPQLGISPKVVLGILQSQVLQFVFKTKFTTLKILKKDLEALPIFSFTTKEQDHIERLVENILGASSKNRSNCIASLNKFIYDALHLGSSDIKIIERFLASRP